MIRLAHISDLHFGAIDPDAQTSLKESVDAEAPDAVVITGDLTQSGRRSEFADAAAFIASFDYPLLVMPGNHDVPVYNVGLRFAAPWRRFRRVLGLETDAVLALPGAKIIGLNSARRAGLHPDWSRGRLSRRQIDFAARELAAAEPPALRLVALHHPVLPGPGKAGATVVSRARHALAAFSGAGADIILTGHVHVAEAGVHRTADRHMIVAQAGTATSTRTRGEAPSYNLLDFREETLSVSVRRYEPGGYKAALFRRFARIDNSWRDAA